MLNKYALNSNNKLVYIDDVENGLACNCICPCCKSKMEAKNGGDIKEHHFAHFESKECEGYRETLLHIWSKEIIKEKMEFTVPMYKSLLGQKIIFNSVEIEKKTEIGLQPDIIGFTDGGLELWIEIFVSHKCEESKISLIKENNINCIEVKIPKDINTKEQLLKILINSEDLLQDLTLKHFINYPFGDNLSELHDKNFKSQDIMCQDCFKNKILQSEYENALKSYNKLYNDFKHIFKYNKLSDLANNYPKLEKLANEIINKRSENNSKYQKMSDEDFDFVFEFCSIIQWLVKKYNRDFYHRHCDGYGNGSKCDIWKGNQ